MPYRKVSYLEQIWYIFIGKMKAKWEWWMAVRWAEEAHPAWVEIHKRTYSALTREVYRKMILDGYRQFRGGES